MKHFKSGGATTWVALTDTPSGMAGSANKLVGANATPDALEFKPVTCNSSGLMTIPTGSSAGIAWGDGDTVIWENADDNIYVKIGGNQEWYFTGDYFSAISAGAGIRSFQPTATIPTLLPDAGHDLDSGIGQNAADQLSLIAGGSEGQRITETTAGNNSLQHTFNGQLGQATGHEIAYEFAYTTNKATSGNDTGLRITFTDTASPGSSVPLEYYKNGTRHFWFSRDGDLYLGESSNRQLVAHTLQCVDGGGIQGQANNITVGVGQTTAFTQADIAVQMANQTFTHSSGDSVGVKIMPNFSGQTGTAGYTGLLVDVTDGSGSGTELLADFQLGGVSKCSISNTGYLTLDATTGNFTSPQATIGGVVSFSSNQGIYPYGANATLYFSKAYTYYSADNQTAFSFLGTASAAITNTGGTFTGMSLTPWYNQASGTSANTDLLINRTETAVGSGAQLLMDLQVGGTSKVKADNAANIGINAPTLEQDSGLFIANASTNPSTQTAGQICISSKDHAQADSKSAVCLVTEAVVEADADETHFSHVCPITINGTEYWIMLSNTNPSP